MISAIMVAALLFFWAGCACISGPKAAGYLFIGIAHGLIGLWLMLIAPVPGQFPLAVFLLCQIFRHFYRSWLEFQRISNG